jgi:hypothetical protein
MFHELKDVETKNDRPRRWFQDEYFDLIVWYDKGAQIHGFQLCYDRLRNEHAFTWETDKGFSHNKIDTGARTGHNLMTPILVADGHFPFDSLAQEFREHSQGLDAGLADLVLAKMADFARQKKN